MADYVLELSDAGTFIVFRPLRPSATEAELLGRWAALAAFAREHGVFRVLFDHRESPPPPNVDMIAAVLSNPEWRDDETWRVAILGTPGSRDHIQYTLESTAEFVSAIRQHAAAFLDLEAAERWLTQDQA